MNKKYGVLGGGSWGTAIVKILTENNNLINWYVRNEDNVNYLREFKKKSPLPNFSYIWC